MEYLDRVETHVAQEQNMKGKGNKLEEKDLMKRQKLLNECCKALFHNLYLCFFLIVSYLKRKPK